jgi:hypothetical protein
VKIKYGTQESVDTSNPAPLTQEVVEEAALAFQSRSGKPELNWPLFPYPKKAKSGEWRPLAVLFIADEPSSKNVDLRIPLVGTQSYKRLLKWIGILDLDIRSIGFENRTNGAIMISETEYDVVIFLGKKAEIRVSVMNFGESHGHTIMPRFKTIDHPSSRNRKFNDPKYETKMLAELRRWLYE